MSEQLSSRSTGPDLIQLSLSSRPIRRDDTGFPEANALAASPISEPEPSLAAHFLRNITALVGLTSAFYLVLQVVIALVR